METETGCTSCDANSFWKHWTTSHNVWASNFLWYPNFYKFYDLRMCPYECFLRLTNLGILYTNIDAVEMLSNYSIMTQNFPWVNFCKHRLLLFPPLEASVTGLTLGFRKYSRLNYLRPCLMYFETFSRLVEIF